MPPIFGIRYNAVDGKGRIVPTYVKVESKLEVESLPAFAERLAREGFWDSNAGHSWWVMPAAIMSVTEVDSAGVPIKMAKPAKPQKPKEDGPKVEE